MYFMDSGTRSRNSTADTVPPMPANNRTNHRRAKPAVKAMHKKMKKKVRALPMSPEMMTYQPIRSRVCPATRRAERKDLRSRFSSRSHTSCLASSRVKVILTTSAGPTWKGMSGNFSQATLPVLCPTPRGVISRPMNTMLNSTSHFHFFIRFSRSSMDMKI